MRVEFKKEDITRSLTNVKMHDIFNSMAGKER